MLCLWVFSLFLCCFFFFFLALFWQNVISPPHRRCPYEAPRHDLQVTKNAPKKMTKKHTTHCQKTLSRMELDEKTETPAMMQNQQTNNSQKHTEAKKSHLR